MLQIKVIEGIICPLFIANSKGNRKLMGAHKRLYPKKWWLSTDLHQWIHTKRKIAAMAPGVDEWTLLYQIVLSLSYHNGGN